MKDGDQTDKVQGKKLRGASGASGTNENGDKDTIKKRQNHCIQNIMAQL